MVMMRMMICLVGNDVCDCGRYDIIDCRKNVDGDKHGKNGFLLRRDLCSSLQR